jgi:HTH-type transcriptional regulator, global nitrogen regulator NrpRI
MNLMNVLPDDQQPGRGKSSSTGRSARARFAILKALDELGGPAGASKISEMLDGTGTQLQARTVRFHLLKMDQEGLTQSVARHEGRLITETGRNELARSSVLHRVGFVASKMDEAGYRMSLDVETGRGSVVSNVAVLDRGDLSRAIHYMKPIFSAGLSMGDRIAVKMPGGHIGETETPRGKVMLATICSVTINGVFLQAGIPVASRFGGLVEMSHGDPKRFIELNDYQGSSMDPHKLFIMANMTKVSQCAASGSGVIGVSFREFPAVAIDKARKLIDALKELNLNGILAIGRPNRPLLDIPVGEGRVGMIAIDGLNPIGALHEAGVHVELSPLSGLEELGTFVPFKDVAPMARRSTFVD